MAGTDGKERVVSEFCQADSSQDVSGWKESRFVSGSSQLERGGEDNIINVYPAFRKQVEARKLFWYLFLQDNLQDVKTKQKTIPLPKKAPLKQKQSKNHE